MPLQPGDQFGRYELTELLGQGGMGEVYSARDTLLRRRVALKVLRPAEDAAAGADPKAAARILREARAAAGLTHPNAVAVYDVGEVDGVPFLAMELVAGKTLRAFVREEGVPLARRIRWLVDVARALGAAHKLGLVHRDIKPENIMVNEDGVSKVLDFGIARQVTGLSDATTTAERAVPSSQSGNGLIVGTPLYMAPEQMRAEAIDGRADQFSWGVVAYELLTGALPWNRNVGELALIEQILKRDVGPLRLVNSEIPVAVDAAIRVALAKNARSRFETMQEIADKLEPYAAPGGGAASPTTTMESPHRTQALGHRSAHVTPAAAPPPSVAHTPHPAAVSRRIGTVLAIAIALIVLAIALVAGSSLGGSD